MDRNYQNRDCCLGKKKILCQKCYLLGAYNFRHTFVPYIGTIVNSISLSKRKNGEWDMNIYYLWLIVSEYTHPFNGPFSGTTRVSRYQKGKTYLDFTEARDSEWQWHQLGHMQVCTSLQTDNHASTPPLSFYRPDALPAAQPTASKHCRQSSVNTMNWKSTASLRPTENAYPPDTHMYSQTDGQPENIMPAVPSTTRAKTKKCMLIFYYFLVYEIDGTTLAASTTFCSLLTTRWRQRQQCGAERETCHVLVNSCWATSSPA